MLLLRHALLFALVTPSAPSRRTIQGDACLPRDVILMLRGEVVENVARECRTEANKCTPGCMAAVHSFKQERCWHALSRSQHKQPWRTSPSLESSAGIWYALYPSSGVELMELEYDAVAKSLRGTKLTGNQYVRAGRVSWEATPVGCRVVSSLYAGVYSPRWDPCTLTMWQDQLTVDLGDPADAITLVRARAPLLLAWDEPRAPTYGFADVFERCGVTIDEPLDSLLDLLRNRLHHSASTGLIDQMLVWLPLVVLAAGHSQFEQGTLIAFLVGWGAIACARLSYLGVIDPFG